MKDDGTLECGICGTASYSEVESLRYHAKTRHPGEPRTQWQVGYVPCKRGPRPKAVAAPAAVATPPPSEAAVTTYDADADRRRTWPPESDRHNAEALTALPWLRYPTDRVTCDAVVAQCDAVLHDRRASEGTKRFFSSLRAHIAALRERFKVAA